MDTTFSLSSELIGRFAVVKLWPELKTAEDECIARIKVAACSLGLECVEIYADGSFINEPGKKVNPKKVDFALHLHYDTPKLYDTFSFVALWNPPSFYHSFGYARTTRNLLTHDDFLSCSSPAADDHIIRSIKKTNHLPPHFNLYHSVATVYHSPSLGDKKLFYAGINWEALGKNNPGRHAHLLKLLDKTQNLRIYGPQTFMGVKVWDGYKSYVGDIPFDGVSMMDEIAKAGISLVLSSAAHKESELMSNRLFESISAGAVIICDENNFAKKFFGNTLLYIDTRHSTEKTCAEILKHLTWIKNNPTKAIQLAKEAQKIFLEKFTLKQNLQDLYASFVERKQSLLNNVCPQEDSNFPVQIILLLPEYSRELFEKQINNVTSQTYPSISALIVTDKRNKVTSNLSVKNCIAKTSMPIDILEIDFFSGDSKNKKNPRRFGEVMMQILEKAPLNQSEAIIFVAPHEEIFSNHVQNLAGALRKSSKKNCVAAPIILKNSSQQNNAIYEKIDFSHFTSSEPNSFARFIFRTSIVKKNSSLDLTLPYLNNKVLAALIGNNRIYQEAAPSVVVDVKYEYPFNLLSNEQENAVIHAVFPKVFKIRTGHEVILPYVPPPPPEVSPPPPSPPPEEETQNDFSPLLLFAFPFTWSANQIKLLARDGFPERWSALKKRLIRNAELMKMK